MSTTVADIIRYMDEIAPRNLAEKWDHVGLQIGHPQWPVHRVVVALDATADVIKFACESNTDLLITHHPLLFQPIHQLDFSTFHGQLIYDAISHRLAIFAAHTNLDSALGGVNDVLTQRIGLQNIRVLVPGQGNAKVKLVFFVPVDHEQAMVDCLKQTGAGKIGTYACCSFRVRGTGTFIPETGSTPYLGNVEELNQVEEVRIETILEQNQVQRVVERIQKAHPYETMAYDVYPLEGQEDSSVGLGRVGDLSSSTDLETLARQIKSSFGLDTVRVTGKPDLRVETVAVCSGSGASLIKAFFASGAQVYITGDIRYHDARHVADAGLGLIDMGHFASEHVVLDTLARQLQNRLRHRADAVTVDVCRLETDPFRYV